MRTLVIGCNHRSAPVEIREKLAFDEAGVEAALRRFREEFAEAEAVLLSTCNRVELYCARPINGRPRIADAVAFLARCQGLDPAELAGIFYHHGEAEAIRHLFRVASSLDSMVLGESQILAQTRTAFETARRAQTAGRTLGELFPRAFQVAKEIHTRTTITSGRVSVGSVAVDLARQIFSRFDDKIVLMVGAGKMGEVTLKHLLDREPKELWVTNRTQARADDLAERIRRDYRGTVRVVPFEQWIARMAEADIVITSTGAREPILTVDRFVPVPELREYRPLLIVDIAVPRDVDPRVGQQDTVFLYNIDDLQTVTEQTLAQRREALTYCQQIIEANVLQYLETQASRDLGPVIQALQQRLHGITEQELQWLMPKLKNAGEEERKLIEQMLNRITGKLMHYPVDLLRKQLGTGTAGVYADMLRAMFDLRMDEEDELPPTESDER